MKLVVFLTITILFSACVPSPSKSLRSRVSSGAVSSANVGVNEGLVLEDNPIILANNPNISPSFDLNKLVSASFITTNSFLKGNTNCFGLDYCFEVRETNQSISSLQTSNGKWGFNTKSEEFLQVNTYYHLSKIFDRFFENLGLSYGVAYDAFSFPMYDTAIPTALYNLDGSYNLADEVLMAYSNCDVADNSFFDRANYVLCFGYTSSNANLRWAQDSTIIYHEASHYLQKLQFNFRNTASVKKAELGSLLYDEPGSIGEGLADFYSYYVNGRSHFAEWAAGRLLKASRPMSEDDALHAPGISKDRDQRLKYPDYVTYDPNFPSSPVEDIHSTGMIISHYLVALTEDIQEKCSMNKKDSLSYVMHLINEILAEHGDLSSTGTVLGAAGKINLNATYSSEWINNNNPLNVRAFAQSMAKNLLNTLGNPSLNLCNGSVYQKDYIEGLLDDYGLLIFRTYNQHRNESNGVTKINTAITNTNRKKSTLINKSSLIFDPTSGASTAFVIDDREQINAGIASYQSAGLISSLSPQTPSDLGFNNDNSKVSPGEVVAIALNLYNNSNSTMGGIQILANDWDHADTTLGATYGRPCRFSTALTSDAWPLESEGGSTSASCNTIAATAADYAPVCFVQFNEENATKWISQKEFREKIALDSNLCLNGSSDKDCFMRAIKGADKALYSKINPKSTWGQTMANPTTGEAYSLDWGNVLLFEVSKHIPPGTVFDCRLRLRFSNCEDCYHDSTRNNYDFYDIDYNGPKPFKIIHLQIPVTD